jgi:hypothetical protein
MDGQGKPRKAGDTETYRRINDNLSSYKADVLIVTECLNQQAVTKKNAVAELEYWDYFREVEQGGRKFPQFLFVEMNLKNGWFQIWQGEFLYL